MSISYTVSKTMDKVVMRWYKEIEAYLQYILDSPSLVNRLLPYYRLGFNPDETLTYYLMFQDTVVKVFKLELV